MAYRLTPVLRTTAPTTFAGLEEGDLAVVEDANSSYAGEVVLRSFNAVVSLSVPDHIWSEPLCVNIQVRKLRVGESVTLTVTD